MPNSNGESDAVALARQQGEIDALRQRIDRLESELRDWEEVAERRHGELRQEMRRGLDAQTVALGRLAARMDAAVEAFSSRVPPEMAQRLADARAREAATRSWAVALVGALAVVAAALVSMLWR